MYFWFYRSSNESFVETNSENGHNAILHSPRSVTPDADPHLPKDTPPDAKDKTNSSTDSEFYNLRKKRQKLNSSDEIETRNNGKIKCK